MASPLRALLPASALAALALALPAAAQTATDSNFQATGEVRFRVQGGMSTSASYNGVRVVGPAVNVSRRDDGTWAGDLLAGNLDLHTVEGKDKDLKVEGAGFTLVQRQVKDGHELEGLYNGVRFRATIEAKRVKARFGNCSIDVEKKGTVYRGDVGCLQEGQPLPVTGRAVLDLMGDALERGPFPQLGLALMAVLPQ
ncbi:MAG: hypothetical protein U0229_23985 [Anaeromyxobacter sp.]